MADQSNGEPNPLIVVISGPSGVGKDTLLEQMSDMGFDYHFTVTATTREPRPGEEDGINHYFVSRDRFLEMVDNAELLEWARVFGNFYGVPREQVRQALAAGRHVLIRVDVQGARRLKEIVPEAVFIIRGAPIHGVSKSQAQSSRRELGRRDGDAAPGGGRGNTGVVDVRSRGGQRRRQAARSRGASPGDNPPGIHAMPAPRNKDMTLPDPIGLFEAIDSQRTLRYIKPDPVPPEYIQRILEAAVKAPSGGNSQPWEFVVVQDAGLKKSLAGLYKQAWADAEEGQPPPPDTRSHRSARHLMEHMEEAPVLIVVCLRVGDREPGCTKDRASIPPSRTCCSRQEAWASRASSRTAGQSTSPS